MLLAMMLVLAVQDAPVTYREARTLPPRVAGDRMLGKAPHRAIVSVEPERIVGPVPLGSARLYLLERPERVAGGCVRRKWIVDFAARDPARLDDATVRSRFAAEEVGLADRGACDRAVFVGSNGPDRARVLALLSAFERWRLRPGAVRVTCAAEGASAAICASPAQTRAALMRAVPWHVPGPLQMWVRVDGRSGYTVAFDALPATAVALTYRVPAPF